MVTHFVMQEQWRDSETDKLLSNRFKASNTKLLEVDDDEDLEELDKTDDFERAYVVFEREARISIISLTSLKAQKYLNTTTHRITVSHRLI